MFKSSPLEGFSSPETTLLSDNSNALAKELEQQLQNPRYNLSAETKVQADTNVTALDITPIFDKNGHVLELGQPRLPDTTPLKSKLKPENYDQLEDTLKKISRLDPIQTTDIDKLVDTVRNQLSERERQAVDELLGSKVERDENGRVSEVNHGWGKGKMRVSYDKDGNPEDVYLADGQHWHHNADGTWDITVPGKAPDYKEKTYKNQKMSVEVDQKTGDLRWTNFPGTGHEEHRQVSAGGEYNPDTTKPAQSSSDAAQTKVTNIDSEASTTPTSDQAKAVTDTSRQDTNRAAENEETTDSRTIAGTSDSQDQREGKTIADDVERGDFDKLAKDLERLAQTKSPSQLSKIRQLMVKKLHDDFMVYSRMTDFPTEKFEKNIQKAVSLGLLTESEMNAIFG